MYQSVRPWGEITPDQVDAANIYKCIFDYDVAG